MITRADETDGTHIVRLTAATNVFKPAEVGCVEELWDDYLKQGERSGYHFLVYREGDQILGYACYGPHALTHGAFDLYWVAVDPGAQGRGIGHALITRVEDEVRRIGGRMVLVETSGTPAYAAARRLYESSGYRHEAVIHDFYDKGDDLIMFRKSLEAPELAFALA